MMEVMGNLFPHCQGNFFPIALSVKSVDVVLMILFRESFLLHVEQSGKSLRHIAEGSDVSYEQLKKLKQGKALTTNVDDAIKIARFFGKTLDEFLDDPSIRKDAELLSLLSDLQPQEREFLLNAARAQIDARRRSHEQSDEEDG